MESNLLPEPRPIDPGPRSPGKLVQPHTAGLVNYALILLSRRWWVIAAVALGGLVGVAAAWLADPVYEAEVVVLPESTASSTSSLLMSGVDFPFLGGRSSAPLTNFHRKILESRVMAERVARRLELPSRARLTEHRRTREELLFAQSERLRRHIRIEESGDRFSFNSRPAITLYAQSPDPVLAADIASTYVLELDRFIRETTVSSASRLRLFVERRLEETNRELEESQRALQAFQEEHGAVSVEEQASATISLLSELQAQRVAAMVALEAERELHAPEHSRVRSLQAQVDALERTIQDLTYSDEEQVGVENEGKIVFYVPLTRIPSLSFEAKRLLLATTTQAEVVGLLTRQLEQAKIEEEKNLPLVTVLGQAAPPNRPISPDLRLNLVMGVMIGLFGGIFLAFGHYFVTGPGKSEEMLGLREALSHTWREDRRRVAEGARHPGPVWRRTREWLLRSR